MINIINSQHPTCLDALWKKWRLTYAGGDDFINEYLIKFSEREQTIDFINRKKFTYCPAFAKAAVDNVKNAIFQRIADVTRAGGPDSWVQSCAGKNRGVDLHGSTMNSFIGRKLLVELLTMGKVGVFIDRERKVGVTKADIIDHPYIYLYKIEDIRSWKYIEGDEFQTLLLRDCLEQVNDVGLPTTGVTYQYRLIKKVPEGVLVSIFDAKNILIEPPVLLNLPRIPFVIFEITDSLLKDVANYQISLLNMESSDIAFCLKGNFPFYTEQVDPRTSHSHLKKIGSVDQNATTEGVAVKDSDTEVGSIHGRRYPTGTDRPDFIAPPTGPLTASIAKQKEIKQDIRLLVNLSLANVRGQRSSAESKTVDERGLEAGLSAIGMELEHGERQIAEIWATYEGKHKIQPTVTYPKRYSLKTEEELLKEAEALEDRMKSLPSGTYKKEIAKKIADLMLGPHVSLEILEKVHKEIDTAKLLTTDPEIIEMMVEKSLLSNETASQALGAPEGEVEQAKKDAAERAANILKLQQKNSPAARGAVDIDVNSQGADDEKAGSQAGEIHGESKVRS